MATVKATLPFLAAERSGRRDAARGQPPPGRAARAARVRRALLRALRARDRAPSRSATRACRIPTSSPGTARPRALSAPGPRFPLGVRAGGRVRERSRARSHRRRALAPADRRPARGARRRRRAPRLRALRVAALGRARIRTRSSPPCAAPTRPDTRRRLDRALSRAAPGVKREPLLAALARSHAVRRAGSRVARAGSAGSSPRRDDPFARDNPDGHVTGSAVVARPDGSAFLLVLHRKLGRWLQPGGHTEESDASVFGTALREAREETGHVGLRGRRSRTRSSTSTSTRFRRAAATPRTCTSTSATCS